jgi:hypothetical protein
MNLLKLFRDVPTSNSDRSSHTTQKNSVKPSEGIPTSTHQHHAPEVFNYIHSNYLDGSCITLEGILSKHSKGSSPSIQRDPLQAFKGILSKHSKGSSQTIRGDPLNVIVSNDYKKFSRAICTNPLEPFRKNLTNHFKKICQAI